MCHKRAAFLGNMKHKDVHLSAMQLLHSPPRENSVGLRIEDVAQCGAEFAGRDRPLVLQVLRPVTL
jgi:hypothetical protein